MERVSIISGDDGSCSIFVRNGTDVVELAGMNNPWSTLFKAIVKMKLLKLKKIFKPEGKGDEEKE
jgi:hypothetical protein